MATTAHSVKMLSSMYSLLEVFLISTFTHFLSSERNRNKSVDGTTYRHEKFRPC
jgi:hypothetical protein